MKKRDAFTLIEVLIAVMLSAYIAAAMAVIYSTASRHMFQDYRSNIIKGNVGVAMRAIGNAMTQATRIDAPNLGFTGNILAVAANVDQRTGCYPVMPGVAVTLHYFCTAASPDGSLGLFYQTASPALKPGCTCPSLTAPVGCAIVYPACGGTQLASHIDTTVPLFSRAAALPDYINDAMSVRVNIRSIWNPAVFGTTQRKVDFTLTSTFAVSSSQ